MFYVIAVIVVLVAIVASEFCKSRASGWWGLAQKYQCNRDFRNNYTGYYKCSKVGFVSYSNSLRIGTTRKGLYLKPLGMYIPYFHPTLFIPWSDIANITDTTFMFQKMLLVEVADPPVKLTLPQCALDDASEYWCHLYYVADSQ